MKLPSVARWMAACALACASGVHALPFEADVALDTSALAGPFEVAFALTDGSGTGDANIHVVLSDLQFAGGSPGAIDAALTFGGVTGDLASAVEMVDSTFLNVFASSFLPGASFSFHVAVNGTTDAGGTPDQLAMVLLRADGTLVDSTDPSGAGSLLTLAFAGPQPAVSAFAGALTPAPSVQLATPVPEPGSLVLFAAALAGVRMARRRRGGDG